MILTYNYKSNMKKVHILSKRKIFIKELENLYLANNEFSRSLD